MNRATNIIEELTLIHNCREGICESSHCWFTNSLEISILALEGSWLAFLTTMVNFLSLCKGYLTTNMYTH